MVRDYRKTYRDLGRALKAIDEQDMAKEMDPAARRAAVEAAHAPNDAAREAMIEAPVVSVEDIAAKLRFLLGVGGGDFDPGSWEGRIVKNILRDVEPAESSLRALRERCKAAFRASQEATNVADLESFRVRDLHPPCPDALLVEFEGADGKQYQRSATEEDLAYLTKNGQITVAERDARLASLRGWLAACDAVDAANPQVAALRQADEDAEELWLALDTEFITAPVHTLDDMIVKLEFLAVMEDMSEDPSGRSPDQIVFGLIRDLKRMTGTKL
ncbi:MAG: hypothetical protein KIS73_19580 [Enhydrobacter sp.]|nr:hypothetical protein [Enhydrobacter sp.]